MNNVRTSYFKRGLVLLMAFIMVFTYMPNSAWGADRAWADELSGTGIESDPYLITSATDFAKMPSSGYSKLTADITVTTPYAKEFTGTFDGDGHTVTLDITGTGSNVGLFSTLGGGATVKNVITAGTISAENKNSIGGIAGSANSPDKSIKIEKCKNIANITGNKAVGGILGNCTSSSGVIIQNCANTGAVTGSNNQVGGIAGNLENTHIIKNCYNAGNITGFNNYAGIIGRGAYGVSIENCYTTGTIAAYDTSTNAGFAIVGGAGSASSTSSKSVVTNCYALENCAGEGKNLVYTTGIADDGIYAYKTADEMKSADFVTTLGAAFRYNNGEYPTLAWEIPTAKVPFNITPANAKLTITKDGEETATYTGTGGIVALPAGAYSYTVSCEGYVSGSGILTVTENQANTGATLNGINVTLEEDSNQWASVTFNVNPNTATFTLKDGDNELTAQSGTTYKVLREKTYTYTATANGHEDENGSYCYNTNGETRSISLKQVTKITLSGEYKTEYVQGDKLDTSGLVVTATLSDGTNTTTKNVDIKDCTVTGFNSTVVADNQEITVTYKGQIATYKVRIEEKLFPSSVFNALKGKATVEYTHNDKFTGTAGQEFIDDSTEGALKSNSAGMGSSQVTVTITFNEEVNTSKFSFMYRVSSEKSYGSVCDGLQINGGSKIGGEITWTKKELTVKGGDKITLTYVKDYSGDSGSDCVWLKEFKLEPLYTLAISPKDTDDNVVDNATVVIKDASGNTVSENNGAYIVEAGTYTYTVSAFGYESATGKIDVSGGDVTQDVTLTKLTSHTATFNVTLPDNLKDSDKEKAKISVGIKSNGKTVKTGTGASYSVGLPAGKYDYTITHPNCDDVTGTITIENAGIEESVTMARKLVFSDFFDELDGITAVNDSTYPYEAVKDDSGNYIRSSETIKNYGTASITLTATRNVKLSFDYLGSNYDYSSYTFTVKKGSTKILTSYGKKEWKAFSVNLNKGERLTLSFEKPYSNGSTDYCVKLKNFTVTPLAELTFTGAPNGASITVKQGENTVAAETDGSYLLEEGSYTYSVSAYGYESITDVAMTVSADETAAGAKTQTISMTESTKQAVKFEITKPEGITAATSVTIKSGDNTVATLPQGDGQSYEVQLPAGTYTYTVTCTGCDDETGSFVVAGENQQIQVTLEKKLVFNDFFDKLDGITAENDSTYPYEAVKDNSGNYLVTSTKPSYYSYPNEVIKLTATADVRLSFDYLGSNYSSSGYAFTVKKGSETLLNSYDKETWETFSADLKAGDILTLTFKKPSYTTASTYYVKLKNFTATPIYSAEITSATAEAEIVVKDGEKNIVEAVSGTTYLLTDGVYTYTASKYGYKPESGSFTISGQGISINVAALEELTKKTVRFSVDPSDAVVTVKHGTQGTIAAETDGSYRLPVGESYEYTITKTDYITVNGTVTVEEDKTISKMLTYAGEAWNGTTKTEPSKDGDVYQISTAAELAWFANEANSKPTISGKLTNNINLNGETWTAFCAYDNSDDNSGFAGTLDGGGNIISGLVGKGGLIDCIAPSGIVKNLRVVGEIENQKFDPTNLGGIANTSKGIIENCVFGGKITNNDSGGSTAGIVGRAQSGSVVRNCINTANISNKCVGIEQKLNIGGIAGYTYGTVENCYNTGAIYANPEKTTNKAIGGLVGQLYYGAELRNSYTIGSVTGPATGIGAVVGILAAGNSEKPAGVVSNVHYLAGVCEKAIASDGGAGTAETTAHTAAEMKTALFTYNLGSAFHQDSANMNNGFPILTWQGGAAPVVPEFEQKVEDDIKAIVIKDKTRADALEAEKNEYFRYRDEEITTEEAALELWKSFVKEETDPEYDKLTWNDIYTYFGIDLTNDGTLSPNADSVYRLPETCANLTLPVTGKQGSTIAWSSSDTEIISIDGGTAAVTRPTDANRTITLTATLTNGNFTKTKEFKLLVTSESGAAAETLSAIASKIDRSRAFIQPMQMYDHENIVEVMEQYLAREGYPVEAFDGEGIEVSLVSVGAKSLPQDGVDYIDANGNITSYYKGKGGYSTRAVYYNDVHFKLSLGGAEQEVTMRVHIGWDIDYVKEMLDNVIEQITWNTIKGENINTAEDKNISGAENDWTHTVVSGSIDKSLLLPKTLSDYTFAKISWATVNDEDSQYIYAEDNGDGTSTGILQRPSKGDPDKKITLRATVTFDFWDDYTIDEFTSQSGATEPAESFKLFDVTLAASTGEYESGMQTALETKYPELIRDFVNKAQTVDLTKVTDDLQMPRPKILGENGIMSDTYNQHVTMTSGNTDVLEFNGYHAVIYRPLPGEESVTANYTITITDRRTGSVLAKKTFEMTILPLTEEEISAAETWMKEVCTEEVYWEGIKNENTDKNNVTGDLKSFEEILKNDDGSITYVRGAVNTTFGGIDVDDLPGYSAMHSQPWREFRSSYESVIESEILRVTKPEYDTEVTIDSVFTHTEMGKYWVKFKSDERYARFEQFYKQPVSVTVTVKGNKGTNPNPQPTSMAVTVSVDGKNVKGFKSTSGIAVSGLSLNSTAWDAIIKALTSSGYTYQNTGDYISGITDAGGVTLTDTDTKNSGWLYTVNGKLAEVYMGSYYLKDGDAINLYYTSDWQEDPNAGKWSGSATEESKVITTEDKNASVTTTTTPTETKVTEKVGADGTKEKTATVTVSTSNQTEIIKQAANKKSTEIVLEVASTATNGAQNVQLQLNVSFVKNVSEKTDAALTVNTENGTVSLDQDTIKTVLSEAKGATITLDVNKVANPTEIQKKAAGTNGQILSLTVKSGDKTISDFKTGKVTVTVAISTALQNKRVAAIHIAEDGKIEQMPGKSRNVNGKKCFEFTTSHFSDFALVDADELGLETEDEIDAAALVAKLTPVARSAKTAKGNIKVTTSLDKSDKAIISDLKDAGYTVKYRFYRSTKKAAGYKSAVTKKVSTYTNTTGKKGTKYFYKVQVRVYDESGKLVAKTALKQCKYAARTK